MHVDHIGVERSIEHLAALAGIEAEPATCFDIGAFFEADGDVHPVASAVAECELCAGGHGHRG